MTEQAKGITVRHAVVIGGGLAGMLAAAALCPFADVVTIVERDILPSGPEQRAGLPQARHVHALSSGGARAIERLVPGVSDRLLEAGAQKLPVTSGVLSYGPHGWSRRSGPTPHYLLSCHRDVLDWHVRDLVLQSSRIRLVDGTEAVALVGDARRVTGVRVVGRHGIERQFDTRLVVDASGHSSHLADWLAALGVDLPSEQSTGVGLVHSSRIYQAPMGQGAFPMVRVQARHHASKPWQAGLLAPIGLGRWHVTLVGTSGGEPTNRNEDFVPFALQLAHPLIGMLIARAQPLTDIVTSPSPAAVRRDLERVPFWPDGLVVVGDAAAAHNALGGQGMSVAALGACHLRDEVKRAGIEQDGLARRVQDAITRTTDAAWSLASVQDGRPAAPRGRTRSLAGNLMNRYHGRLLRTSASSPRLSTALAQAVMEADPARLLRPDVLLTTARGPLKAPLLGPPLTAEEQKLLDSAQSH
jgi:2-polyprenyl-6-methoxyphenol hydroxylase-like FAD-dependent oxidoreductase